MNDSPRTRDAVAERLLAGARRGTEPSPSDEQRVRARLHGKILAAPLLLSAKGAHALSFASQLTVAKILMFVGVCGSAAVITGVALRAGSGARSDAPNGAPVHAVPTARAIPPLLPRANSSPNAEALPRAIAQAAAPTPMLSPTPALQPPSPASVQKHAAPVAQSAVPLSPQDMQAEIVGLRRAQQLLHAGSSAGAVAALDELTRQVPAGSLMEERDATRVIALCTLGRVSDASVDSFLTRYPNSVHANRVRTACSRATFE